MKIDNPRSEQSLKEVCSEWVRQNNGKIKILRHSTNMPIENFIAQGREMSLSAKTSQTFENFTKTQVTIVNVVRQVLHEMKTKRNEIDQKTLSLGVGKYSRQTKFKSNINIKRLRRDYTPLYNSINELDKTTSIDEL